MNKNKSQLEIWGRAQREAAWCRKSHWGDSLEGWVKIPLVATSRVQYAVELALTARAVLILVGSTCAPVFFVSRSHSQCEAAISPFVTFAVLIC